MALIKDWQRAKKGRGSITTVILCFVFLLTAELIPKTFCINMSDNIISGRLLWKTLFIFVFHKFSFSFFICHIINLADHALHVKLNFLCEHILDFIFERSSNYFCYFFNCRNTWSMDFATQFEYILYKILQLTISTKGSNFYSLEGSQGSIFTI